MRKDLRHQELIEAEKQYDAAREKYHEATVKHFPVNCRVRWTQEGRYGEYDLYGEVVKHDYWRPGTVTVRNSKTGKIRHGLWIEGCQMVRLDGGSEE